jgi:hypothetical protein
MRVIMGFSKDDTLMLMKRISSFWDSRLDSLGCSWPMSSLKNIKKEFEGLSHPIYKNINRAIIYAPGSSHAYIQQIIKISQHMSRIKACKL